MKDLASIVWSTDQSASGLVPEFLVVDGDPSDLTAAVGSLAVRTDVGTIYANTVAGWSSAGGFNPDADIDFGGLLTIERAEPRLRFYETDRGTDLKNWDVDVQAGVFAIRTRTDADGAGVNVLAATRGTTTAIGTVSLAAGTASNSAQNRLTLSGRSVYINATAAFDDQDGLFIRNSGTNGTTSIVADGVGGAMSFDATEALTLNCNDGEFNGANSFTITSDGLISILSSGDDVTVSAGGSDGDINLNIAGTGTITLGTQLGNFANDAAAAVGGIPVRGLYRNGSIVMIRVA